MARADLISLSQRTPCWDSVLQSLGLEGIKSLRLVNRTLAQRCLAPSGLNHYLECQNSDLSEQSMRDLSDLVAHPLGAAVKKLTVIAAIYDTSLIKSEIKTGTRLDVKRHGMITSSTTIRLDEAEIATRQSDLVWLEQRIEEQKSASVTTVADSLAITLKQFPNLKEIRLDALVISGRAAEHAKTTSGPWSAIWPQAARAFQVVTLAIAKSAKSGVTLESLDFFYSTPRCSIPIREIAAHLQLLSQEGFGRASASIKHLAISFCGFCGEAAEHNEDEPRPADDVAAADGPNRLDDRQLASLADLLEQMADIETLELHYYRTGNDDAEAFRGTLTHLTTRQQFLKLNSCTFRGFFAEKEHLSRFLASHSSIRKLGLESIALNPGPWEEVLSQLKAQLPLLSELKLSNLWSNGSMNLDPVWECPALKAHRREWSYPCLDGTLVHTVVLDATDLEKPLEFKERPSKRPMGSAQFARWRGLTQLECGPP